METSYLGVHPTRSRPSLFLLQRTVPKAKAGIPSGGTAATEMIVYPMWLIERDGTEGGAVLF